MSGVNLQNSTNVLLAGNRFLKNSRPKPLVGALQQQQARLEQRKSSNLAGNNNNTSYQQADSVPPLPRTDRRSTATSNRNSGKSSANNLQPATGREIFDMLVSCHDVQNSTYTPEQVQTAIFRSYSYIKQSHEVQEQLRNLGGFALAVHVLLKYMANPGICEPTLAITCILYRQGYSPSQATIDSYIFTLGPVNVLQIIVDVLRQHIVTPAVVVQACRNIIQMSFNDATIQNELCYAGICSILSNAFDQYYQNEEVSNQLCIVVITLSFNNSHSQRELQVASICSKLVKVLDKHLGNSGTSLQVLWAMRNMSHNNLDFCIEAGESGACELISLALKRFTSSPQIMEQALALVGNLASDRSENQTKFAAAGACDALVQFIPMFTGNASLLEFSLTAIAALASNPSVRYLFVKREIVDIFAHISYDSELSHMWCKCIAEVASDNMQAAERLGIFGACSCMLSTLQDYIANVECVRWACTGIANLCTHDDNISRYASTNLMKTLSQVIAQYQNDKETVRAVFSALDRLSSEKLFQRQIFDENLESSIISTMMAPHGLPAILESGSSILAKLAGSKTDNDAKLLDAGACEALLRMLSNNIENESVTSSTCDSIASVCSENPAAAKHFGTLGICDCIMKQLGIFKGHPDILLKVIWTVENLIRDVPENQERFYALTLHPQLLKMCQRFQANEELVEHIFRVIHLLTSDKRSENFSRFNGNVLCDVTYEMLQRYMNNIDIIEYCCNVVANLSSVKEYVMKLYEAGIFKLLLVIVENNFVNPRVMESCCWAISNLFHEQNKVIDAYDKSATCKLMIKILHDPKSPTKVVAKACDVLADVYTERGDQNTSGLNSTFDALLQALQQYIDIDEVVFAGALALLRLLCSNLELVNKLWTDGGLDTYVKILKRHEANGRVVERVLYCFSTVFEKAGGAISISSGEILECISSSMYHNMKEVGIVKQGIVVLSYAVDNYSSHTLTLDARPQKPFGGCALIVKLLTEHVGDRFIVESGLRSIALVATRSVENKQAFYYAGVCELIMRTLTFHINDGGIIESTSWVLSQLCENFLLAKAGLGTAACDLLLRALGAHIKNSSVVVMICMAIVSLMENVDNRKQLDNAPTYELILKTLNFHNEDSNAVEQCCKLLALIAVGSKGDSRYLRSNICSAVLNALKKHAYSVKVVMSIMQALPVIAQCERDDYRMVLHDLDGCQLIVKALHNLVTDVDLLSSGIDTIEVVCTNCRENKVAIVQGGLFDLVDAIFMHFGSIKGAVSDSLTEEVIIKSFKLIEFVLHGVSANQLKFKERGNTKTFVGALANNISKPRVVLQGSKTMFLLSSHNVEVQSRFWESSACEVLVGALFRHMSSVDVVDAILGAIGCLSSDIHDIVQRLGEVGACELTIKALKIHKANQSVAENGLLIISNCSYGNVSNAMKFCRGSVAFHIIRIIQLFNQVPKVVGYAWGAIINLCSCVFDMRRLFVKEGLYTYLQQVLDDYRENEDLIELSFRVVVNSCHSVPENRTRLAKTTGIGRAMSDLVVQHMDVARIVICGLQAFEAMQFYDHYSDVDFGDYEAIVQTIRSVIDNHPNERDIIPLAKKLITAYNSPSASTQGDGACCLPMFNRRKNEK